MHTLGVFDCERLTAEFISDTAEMQRMKNINLKLYCQLMNFSYNVILARSTGFLIIRYVNPDYGEVDVMDEHYSRHCYESKD